MTWVNSLAPSRFWLNFKWVIFKQILVIDGWVISCEITLRWMSQGLTDNKSTLVQVMAWCRQATSHYLNQCWRRSPTPYGVTRHQWVNLCKEKGPQLPSNTTRHLRFESALQVLMAWCHYLTQWYQAHRYTFMFTDINTNIQYFTINSITHTVWLIIYKNSTHRETFP